MLYGECRYLVGLGLAVGVWKPDLFWSRRRCWLPIASPIHYLAHALKPPISPAESSLTRIASEAICGRKSQFQLRLSCQAVIDGLLNQALARRMVLGD
jgi:hypothetical protein